MKTTTLKARIAVPRGKGFVTGTIDFEIGSVSVKEAPVVLRGRNQSWHYHDGALWRPMRDLGETRKYLENPDRYLLRHDGELALGVRLLSEVPLHWELRGQIEASLGVAMPRWKEIKRASPGDVSEEPLVASLLGLTENFRVIGGEIFERSPPPMLAVRFQADPRDHTQDNIPADRPLTPYWVESTGNPTVEPVPHFFVGAHTVGGRGAPVFDMFDMDGIAELAARVGRVFSTEYLKAVEFDVLDYDAVSSCRIDMAAYSAKRFGRALLSEIIGQKVKSSPMERLRAAHELRRIFMIMEGADPVEAMSGVSDQHHAFTIFKPFDLPGLVSVVSEAIAAVEAHPFRSLAKETLYQVALDAFRHRSHAPAFQTDSDLDEIGAPAP